MKPIHICYFSDVFCLWVYIAQSRLDELKTAFSDRITIAYHFVPVFGTAREKLEKQRRDRTGLQGYSNPIQELTKKGCVATRRVDQTYLGV